MFSSKKERTNKLTIYFQESVGHEIIAAAGIATGVDFGSADTFFSTPDKKSSKQMRGNLLSSTYKF